MAFGLQSCSINPARELAGRLLASELLNCWIQNRLLLTQNSFRSPIRHHSPSSHHWPGRQKLDPVEQSLLAGLRRAGSYPGRRSRLLDILFADRDSLDRRGHSDGGDRRIHANAEHRKRFIDCLSSQIYFVYEIVQPTLH